MKKISTILMALMLLVSMCTFSVSAEGEAVNYAANGQYIYGTPNFLTEDLADDACAILTDGVAPYYSIEEAGKGVVILYNKWDTVEKDSNTTNEIERKIRNEF